MKLTINDIANIAKVSKTTVSRFLNGKYEFMSNETKNKIQAVINETNYRPNILASSLKTKKAKIIGCTIADMQNQFSSFIFKGISEICKKNGYRVLVTEVNSKKDAEKEAIESLLAYNVDGIIVNTIGGNDKYLKNLALKHKIPIVLADRSIKEKNIIDTVTCDNYNATYNCMKHLKDMGFEKVSFFTTDMTNNSVKNLRYLAYLDASKDFFDGQNYTFIDDFNIKQFINTFKNSNMAIFCVNGAILLDILNKVNTLKTTLKEEKIGICSFDDWGWQELLNITTIKQDSYKCGIMCAKLLFKKLNNIDKEVEYIELKTKLIKRSSTKRK